MDAKASFWRVLRYADASGALVSVSLWAAKATPALGTGSSKLASRPLSGKPQNPKPQSLTEPPDTKDALKGSES